MLFALEQNGKVECTQGGNDFERVKSEENVVFTAKGQIERKLNVVNEIGRGMHQHEPYGREEHRKETHQFEDEQ